MATDQEPYDNETNIRDSRGSEATGGELINTNFNTAGSLSFDGSNDEVTFADDASISFGDASTDSPFSISSWVKITTAGSSSFPIVCKGPGGGNYEYFFGTVSGNIWFALYDNSATVTIRRQANSILTSAHDGKWIHVVGTYNGGGSIADIKIYFNGEQVDNTNGSAGSYVAMHATGSSGTIGRLWTNGSSRANGTISNVAILNYELSAQQVFDLYQNHDSVVPTGSGVAAWWSINEGSGTAIDNTQGDAALDGTAVGSPVWDTTDRLHSMMSRTLHDTPAVITGSSTSINNLLYSLSKKPGQSLTKLQFSSDYDTTRENILSFDGVNDDVNIGSIGTVNTIAFWCRAADVTSQKLINIDDTDQIEINGSDTVVATSFPGTTAVYVNGDSDSAVVYDNVWFHVTITDTTGVSATIFEIGQVAGTFGACEIANVATWSDVLTADEALAVFSNATYPADNRVGFWELHEGSGSTAIDDWGSNNGTITSASWTTEYDLANKITTWQNPNGDSNVHRRGSCEFDGVNDRIVVSSSASIDDMTGGGFSFCAWIKPRSDGEGSFGRVWDKGPNKKYVYLLGEAAGRCNIAMSLDTTSSGWTPATTNLPVVIDEWNFIAILWDGALGNDPTFIINGISQTPSTGASGSIVSDAANDLWIGNRTDTARSFDGWIADFRMYSEELSATDMFDLMTYNTEPSATNLELHLKMDSNALDETANDNDGAVTGAIPSEQKPVLGFTALGDASGLLTKNFDGTNDYVSIGSVTGTVFSISLWVKMTNVTSQKLLNIDGTDQIEINASDDVVATSFPGTTVYYVNGVQGEQGIVDFKWHHIVITDTTGVTASTFEIGRVGATYGQGQIANVALFDGVLTDEEVQALYTQGFVDNTSGHLKNYWPLMGDFLDYEGTDNGTNNGVTEINDAYRPIGTDGAPSQVTIDLSALSYIDTVYVKTLIENKNPLSSTAFAEYTIDYTDGAGGRRIIIVRRR